MLAHTQHIHTATIRQVQLSQISVADVTNASLHTAQAKEADPIFLGGKFCVTELPPMEESNSSQ